MEKSSAQTTLEFATSYQASRAIYVVKTRYFRFPKDGRRSASELAIATATDAAHDRARAATISDEEDFDLGDVTDLRERRIAEVVRRRGQAKSRAALIDAYEGKCVITRCDATEALEAAHISPYRGEQTNHPQNGLLLRADLHSLFDLGLIVIEPSTMKVAIAAQLKGSSYATLPGQELCAFFQVGKRLDPRVRRCLRVGHEYDRRAVAFLIELMPTVRSLIREVW